MKIFLSSENSPKTHIDLIHGNTIPGADESDLSFYLGEEEVLLFPYFAYQVLRVEEKYIKQKNTYLQTIVMIELPFQNLLKLNPSIEQTAIVCVSDDINEFDYCAYEFKHSDEMANWKVMQFDDKKKAIQAIKQTVRVVLIFGGRVGKSLVQDIYNGLNEIPNIEGAISYCMNTEKNKVIFNDYPVVKSFATNEESLIQSTKEMINEIIVRK